MEWLLPAAIGSLPLASTATATATETETETGVFAWKRMTGEWGGLRSALRERGIHLDVFYTFDLMGLAAGGLETGVDAVGNLDLILDVDLNRLVGWPGARLFVYGLGTHGGGPSQRIGDLQGVNNVEAPHGWKLFELHLRQDLFEDRLSLLVGLYDINSEFDVLPVAAFFIHSSFGMGGDVGTSGLSGPSTFPVTSLAARLQVRPLDPVFVRVVVADGVPGDPQALGRTHIHLGGGDGVLWMAEAGWLTLPSMAATERVRRRFEELPPPEDRTYGYFGKVAVGAWGYTTDFARSPPGGRSEGQPVGVYALVQQAVFREPTHPSEGLVAFARGGIAGPRGHVVRAYVGGGLVYEGITSIFGRDRLGFGVAAAKPVTEEPWEIAMELTYRIPVLRWLSLQPDVQLVVEPAAAPGADDALLLGLRALLQL